MKDYLLWRKMSRVIILLSEQLHVAPERALAIFYDSNVCTLLHDSASGLECLSDAYIVDEIILELQRKQG